MVPKIPLSIVLTLCLATSAFAQDDFKFQHDRFQLWNACEPVRLLVEDLNEGATKIGLTRNTIETTVRSRLRAARIYTDSIDADTYLYVNVLVTGSAFNVKFSYNKYLLDSISGEGPFFAVTWTKGTTGIASGSDFILSVISQRIHGFVDEYLRVNADACS